MAEHKLLKLTISRVDGPVIDEDVISVRVPGVVGEMQLLAHHEPLISPLKNGHINIVKADGSTEAFPVESGTLEVSNNHATILI